MVIANYFHNKAFIVKVCKIIVFNVQFLSTTFDIVIVRTKRSHCLLWYIIELTAWIELL